MSLARTMGGLVGRWVGHYEARLDAAWAEIEGWGDERRVELAGDFDAALQAVLARLGAVQVLLSRTTPGMAPAEADAAWERWAGHTAWYTAVQETWRREVRPETAAPDAGAPPLLVGVVAVVGGVVVAVTALGLAWALSSVADAWQRVAELEAFEKELDARLHVFEKTGEWPKSELPKPPPDDDGVGIVPLLLGAAALGGGLWWLTRKAA